MVQTPRHITSNCNEVVFGTGKLGFMARAGKDGINVVFVAKDSQAYDHDVIIGDKVLYINSEPIENLLRDSTDMQEFAHLVKSLQEKSGSISIGFSPKAQKENDDVLKLNEKNVIIAAGDMYKRVVMVEKGQVMRLKFWLSGEDMDIGFRIQEDGEKDVVYAHTVACNKTKPCGPTSFTAKRDGKFTLVFDNGHSWVRSKMLNYYLEVLPSNLTLLGAERLVGEAEQLKGAIKLMDGSVAHAERQLGALKKEREEMKKNLERLQNKIHQTPASLSPEACKFDRAANATPNMVVPV